MYTRKDYLNKECTHDEYYRQFVSDGVIDMVGSVIGVDRIKASNDPHFNDIPLREWDKLDGPYGIRYIMNRNIFKMANCPEYIGTNKISWSNSDCISIAKQAARMIVNDEQPTYVD